MKKIFLVKLTLLISISIQAQEHLSERIALENNSELALENWDTKYQAWSNIFFKDKDNGNSFYLYNPNESESTKGFLIDTSSKNISPDKKFLIVQRIEPGELYNRGKTQETENLSCDILRTVDGCVLLSRDINFCSGSWQKNEWHTENGTTLNPKLETPSPNEIITKIKPIKDSKNKGEAIKEIIYMGIGSYLACHPARNNIQSLNDIGFYIAESGDYNFALEIYRKIESISPERTVLKLNIADSLWSIGKLEDAKKYYKSYKDSMILKNSSKKIPERVNRRLISNI